MKCDDEINQKKICCDKSNCRYYILFEEDLNCSLICAKKNPDGLKLSEVGERMHLSLTTIFNIHNSALKKMNDLLKE